MWQRRFWLLERWDLFGSVSRLRLCGIGVAQVIRFDISTRMPVGVMAWWPAWTRPLYRGKRPRLHVRPELVPV